MVRNIFCGTQGGAYPLLGRESGHLLNHWMQLPAGGKQGPASPVGTTTFGEYASWPLGALVLSFRRRFSPSRLFFTSHHFPSPSPEVSLLLSLSSPTESVDIGQLQYHFSQLMRPASFGLQMACLNGSQAEVRDVCFTLCRPRSSGLSWLETYESDRSLNLISCSGWKPNCSDILTFIFLPPRKAALGTG